MSVLLPTLIVLASGRGERFAASGGQGSKLAAPLAGVPVLERTLAAARASGLPWHAEDAGHPGMGDSIAAAVRATQHAHGWLILPGDLPLVQPGTLRDVATALISHPAADAVVPTFDGERGHPVAFSARARDALLALAGPTGAASVLQQAMKDGRCVMLAVSDAGVRIDVDTVADLRAAERHLAGPPG
jgi:molybdenum cofactor cytidylyltransferase